jgi:hypothetical protein
MVLLFIVMKREHFLDLRRGNGNHGRGHVVVSNVAPMKWAQAQWMLVPMCS